MTKTSLSTLSCFEKNKDNDVKCLDTILKLLVSSSCTNHQVVLYCFIKNGRIKKGCTSKDFYYDVEELASKKTALYSNRNGNNSSYDALCSIDYYQ